MMFALCTAVTRLRRCLRAYSNAKVATRIDATSVMIFRLSTTPGTTSCSSPEYRSSVFSRTITRSTPSYFEATDGMFQTGRRLVNRSSAFRRPTCTLVNPPPTGVVTGPLSATLLRRIESSSSSGSVEPWRSSASTPARWDSHSTCRPALSRILTTAPLTSGPMPSPGMSVIVCFTRGLGWCPGRSSFVIACFPGAQRQRADEVHHHQPRRERMERVEADAAGVPGGQECRKTADFRLDRVDGAEHHEARVARDE